MYVISSIMYLDDLLYLLIADIRHGTYAQYSKWLHLS